MPGRNYRQCRDRWNHYLCRGDSSVGSDAFSWKPQTRQRQLISNDYFPTRENEAKPEKPDGAKWQPPETIWEDIELFRFPSEGNGPFDTFF
jgi:hypothetical protein